MKEPTESNQEPLKETLLRETHEEGFALATHIDRMPVETARRVRETFSYEAHPEGDFNKPKQIHDGKDLEEWLKHGIYERRHEDGKPVYQGYSRHDIETRTTIVELFELQHYGVTPFMGPAGGQSCGIDTMEEFQKRIERDTRERGIRFDLQVADEVWRRPDLQEMENLAKTDKAYHEHCRMGGLIVIKRGKRIPRPTTYRRGAPKIRRNDPCPCGSGRKAKKCCLGNG